ncbi:TonB-dependent receptor [Bordetella pseudohinzii]|uniref:TonB-dependent receptor n=2 Tax=Bordetella pseudohinzii TaxID=1331258 RepID=A0A0J6CAV0_9BORD|nr:TonB-dependent receptor plug domain-containing protein [Bordetella pseudohinzii]ANY16656.1 TonB-dependent receptor [Bordetella pseudohinzii]KMM27816.1 TonB-dependent receptor [Bordetella pseudohinzii]KXA77633.1 TonB-dependent receptor [Bordetella pseudohinzii]KXA81959.1 TonB-dependent receptor [Bordetella pseudohinzii]CUI29649.1 TonB-dependent Receptor Plug Domain [Bordetella pseudohinzii]
MWISPLRRIAALTPLLLCGNAQAQDPSPPARTGPPWLEPVTVTAPLPREHIFTRSEIQATPAANRDLSSLISTLPSIRLDNAAADSADRGSLDVPNIVIHGASPYQNLFLLNGVDATSRVDPANKDRQLGSVPGNPQAYFLDTALLGEVRVFDSGIPVEYGTFTGGVVDARLRRPSGGNHVEFGYRWNGSNLTRQKIPDYDAEQWAQGEPGFSPTWRKRFYTVTTDLSLGEQSAVILGGSRRESRIGRWRLGSANHLDQLEHDNYLDRVDNFIATFNHQPSAATTVELDVKHANRREHLVSNVSRDTDWRNQHIAQGLGVNLEHDTRLGLWSLRAGLDGFNSRQRSAHNAFVQHEFEDGRPEFSSGGYGKSERGQRNLTLDARLDIEPWQHGALRLSPYVGAQLEHVSARFKRYQVAYSYRAIHLQDGTEEQSTKVRHLPGSVNLHHTRLGLYASNELRWRRWNLMTGLRYDGDDFLHQHHVAPRSRLDWDALGDGSTVLSAGWSRYYGTQALKIAMEEEFSRLSELVLDYFGNPVADGSLATRVDYKGIRSPYDDEWAFSLTRKAFGLQGVLSFVHRNGREQLLRRGNSYDGYRYTNEGRSRTRDWSLSISNETPWRLMQTFWQASFSWSYQKQERNARLVEGYDATPAERDVYVIYQGKRIPASKLPPGDFNLPHKLTLDIHGQWPRLGLSWTNVLNWQGRRSDIMYVDTTPGRRPLDIYAPVRLPSHWTWDTRIAWQPAFARGLMVAVDVLNVLNRMPPLTATRPGNDIDESRYRTGREIWLQVAYRY